MSANFTPTRGDYIDLKPFRFWCQKILPLAYDDSLSYYELLCKVVDYLNKAMEDITVFNDDIENIYTAYTELQTYVNTYFDNLDVSSEINNKLDQMADNGVLSDLIEPFVPSVVTQWLNQHLTPGEGVIDKSLSIEGAGADAEVVGGQLAILNKNDIKYDNEYYVNTNEEFLQGAISSSGEELTQYDIHTDYITGGVYLFNFDQTHEYAILRYNGSKTFHSYVGGSVAGTTQNFYKDSKLYLPELAVGYYRIRERRYGESEIRKITPSESSIRLYEPLNKITWKIGAVGSTGYSFNVDNIVSDYMSTKDITDIYITLLNSGYRYAVYSTADNGETFSIVTSGGWTQSPIRLKNDDVKYVIRVGNDTGTTFNYNTARSALRIKRNSVQYSYNREYDDITTYLDWERKSIGTISGVTDSTTRLIAKLPNVGNIEIRMNEPNSRFIVFREDPSNNTFEELFTWSHYTYRYTGNPVYNYWVMVRYETEGTIYPNAGGKCVKVYLYEDVGVSRTYNNLWGKNIAVFGDSIVQGRFTKNAVSGTNALMSQPYSVILGENTNTWCRNYGIGGASVYGSDWRSLYTNRELVTGFDVVFVCAGTNDFGDDVTESDFKSAYNAVIQTLKQNNGRVIVMTPTCRDSNYLNNIGLRLSDYAEFVKSIATANNVEVIDLWTECNNHAEFKSTLTGGIHPNECGHRIIYDIIMTWAKSHF